MSIFSHSGCHQDPNRSFFVKGFQFPVCARCTGVLLGYIVGLLLLIKVNPSLLVGLLLVVPMGIDWIYQKARKKESTNGRRFISGLLGGIGIIFILFSLF